MPGAPADLTVTAYIVLAVIGGIAVGLIGVLLGGCPLRQVVMTAEGNIKSLCFVIGMCIGAVVFAAWVSGWGVALLQHEQPVPSTIGYLQIESPYMNRSLLSAVQCLAAALEVQAGIEVYAYLDGRPYRA